MPELGQLEAYIDIMSLLEKGVAYHHGGMLPVLREFVELCFQQKLVRPSPTPQLAWSLAVLRNVRASYSPMQIHPSGASPFWWQVKLVFATETLAVGVNMPARSVVFSALDKPNDGDMPGHRLLKPAEFWQMAGRAGRRGMDDLGYVIWSPTLSAAGLKNMASATDMREVLVGAMEAARSQLVVDRPFVLRHLSRGYGPEVLLKTLKHDQLRRQNVHLQSELSKSSGGAPPDPALLEAAKRFSSLESKLVGEAAGGNANMVLALNPKQQKAAQAELKALREQWGEKIIALKDSVAQGEKLENEISTNKAMLESQWHEAIRWLVPGPQGGGSNRVASHSNRVACFAAHCALLPRCLRASCDRVSAPSQSDYGFLEDAAGNLTPRGKACAAFADGHPLIIGTIIADGWLVQLSAAEIMAWVCLFLKEGRGGQDLSQCELQPPVPSAAFEEVLGATYELAEILEVELDRNLTLMMLDWVTHKDLQRIASWVDASMLGNFVKAVMRVASYVDVIREVLLGLAQYEVHNKLDGSMDMLYGGLVTNESLYLRMADPEEGA